MGRLTALKLLRKNLAVNRNNARVHAVRKNGVCMLSVVVRPPRPWVAPQRIVVGLADTWALALRQAKSGLRLRAA